MALGYALVHLSTSVSLALVVNIMGSKCCLLPPDPLQGDHTLPPRALIYLTLFSTEQFEFYSFTSKDDPITVDPGAYLCVAGANPDVMKGVYIPAVSFRILERVHSLSVLHVFFL